MSRPEKEILERLRPEGLSRAIDDLFDQPRLVRLANACGLKYPGMRTQSQERQRIVADLVREAVQRATARRALFRALQKETRDVGREWSGLAAAERKRRLDDESFLMTDGNLGRHLFLLAVQEDDADNKGLATLHGLLEPAKTSSAKAGPTRRAAPTRTESRLKKRVTLLERKILHLEGQLAKGRDSLKASKRDLLERKGELAESRMLVERLRAQLETARQAPSQRPAGRQTEQGLTELKETVRKLAAEQKKLVRKLGVQPAKPDPPQIDLAPVLASLDALGKELRRRDSAQDKSLTQQGHKLEELRRTLQAKASSRTTPRRRAKGADARVGVFIDVQNMYYGARRLKGKLDFEALLQAAVGDRRLIQATAYVVESKEIDQTGFIAVLRQLSIEVRRKPLRVRADGSMKGDWDMELALDILDAAPQLDIVVLVSGDGDFTSLVKRVKRIGPRVELLAFPRHTAKALLESADEFQPLDRKFMIYPSRSKNTVPDRPQLGESTNPTRPSARTSR